MSSVKITQNHAVKKDSMRLKKALNKWNLSRIFKDHPLSIYSSEILTLITCL